MTPLCFQFDTDQPEILCLGAHSYDIEICSAGTLQRLGQAFENARFQFVIFSADLVRQQETETAVRMLLGKHAHVQHHFLGFRDGFLPYEGSAPKDALKILSEKMSPDLILTHNQDDKHQDHRLVSEICWNVFRRHQILEYEIPKYDPDLGNPNLFVALTEGEMAKKASVLYQCFASQREKTWFTADVFESLARIRGVQSGSDARYAEAFYARKNLLSV
jgi:LmbE family N-acetylglucosaminyl deacetylase